MEVVCEEWKLSSGSYLAGARSIFAQEEGGEAPCLGRKWAIVMSTSSACASVNVRLHVI